MSSPPGPSSTNAETLHEPMGSRWSPSIFDDQHRLSREDLESLLSAAQWAPSEGNSQPWAFVVAERDQPSHKVLVRHLSRGNSGWVPRASAVLIALAQTAPDADGNGGGQYTQYDLGQAAAHVTLQARAMGLHTHQFSGFDRDAVQVELEVPAHFRVMTGIAVGVRGNPADVDERSRGREQKVRQRKPLASFVHGDAWGRPWPTEGVS